MKKGRKTNNKVEITEELITEIKEAEKKANKEGWLTIEEMDESMHKTFPCLKK